LGVHLEERLSPEPFLAWACTKQTLLRIRFSCQTFVVLLVNRGVSHTRKLEISLGKQARNSVDEEAVAAAGTRWQAPDSTTRPTGRTEFRLTNCAIDRSMATNNWLSYHPKHNSDLQLKKKKKKLVLLFVPDSNTQFNSLPQIEHQIDHKMMMIMMKMCHFCSRIPTSNSILSHKLSIWLTTRWWWWWWKCVSSFCFPTFFQNSNTQFNSLPQIWARDSAQLNFEEKMYRSLFF